jgi:hypothetical protein
MNFEHQKQPKIEFWAVFSDENEIVAKMNE